MTKKQPEDTKLLMLPSELVDRLRDASSRNGTSLSGYAIEVLEEALRAEKLGARLGEAVEAYRMDEIHRGAGAMVVPRSSLGHLVEDLNGHGEYLCHLGGGWSMVWSLPDRKARGGRGDAVPPQGPAY